MAPRVEAERLETEGGRQAQTAEERGAVAAAGRAARQARRPVPDHQGARRTLRERTLRRAGGGGGAAVPGVRIGYCVLRISNWVEPIRNMRYAFRNLFAWKTSLPHFPQIAT